MTVNLVVTPDLTGEVDEALAVSAVEAALRHCQVPEPVEVGLRITNDAEIQELNERYRGVGAPTDVLSFAAEDSAGADHPFSLPPDVPRQLGDVIVSYPRAMEQSKDYGHDLNRELAWLVVHGTLQLLGYTHDSEEQARNMRAQEEAILAHLGLQMDSQKGRAESQDRGRPAVSEG